MQAILNTPEITPANTKATLEASHFVAQFGCTISIWSKADMTRVYINKGRNTSYGYVEFRASSVTANADNRMQLEQITEVLAGELVQQVAAQPTVATQARNWDNLHNEGVRDGGYNPYRAPRVEGYGVTAYAQRINPAVADMTADQLLGL